MAMRLVGLMVLFSVLSNSHAQATCSGEIDETLEDFKVRRFSMDAPTGFDTGLTCSWTLRAANNKSTIAYQLTDINLGLDDIINVYAGTSTADQNVQLNLTGIGTSLTIGSVTTPDIHLVFQTGSDLQTVRQSFVTYYMAGSDQSGAVSCVNQTLSAGAETQFLTSLAFPANYPPSSHCSWTITGPESTTLELVFYLIDIEEGDSALCNYDSLVVYLPGQKNTPELLVCRRNVYTPETHTIANNQVQLDFMGDDSDSYGGFVLTYRAVFPPTTTATPKGGCHVISCIIPIIVVIVLVLCAVIVAVILVKKRRSGSSKKYAPTAVDEHKPDDGEMTKVSLDAAEV